MLFYLCSCHVGDTEDTDGGYVHIRLRTCRYVITLFPAPTAKEQGEPGAFYPEGGQTWESMPPKRPNQLRLLDTFSVLRWQSATRLML